MPRKKEASPKRKRKKMSDTSAEAPVPTPNGEGPPIDVAKVDIKNDLTFEVESAGDGASLTIYVRAPLLADVIEKMAQSNYDKAAYADCLKPVLMEHPERKDRVITRAAICKATKNFRAAADFDWNQLPPAIMLANPKALREGYRLTVKIEQPVPPETIKKFGKAFMEGCGDILTNARPFKMQWVMREVPTYK